MKLDYVIIYVEDAVRATEFYREAFGLAVKFVHESKLYVEMETGETTLAFAGDEMLPMNIGIEAGKGLKNVFEIALSTADVQAAFDKAIATGAKALKPMETKPWGQDVAYVADPFGTIVEICTPMKDS